MRFFALYLVVILLTTGITESMHQVKLQRARRCCFRYSGPAQAMLSLFAGCVTVLMTVPNIYYSGRAPWQTCASLAGGTAGIIGGTRNLMRIYQGRDLYFDDSMA